MDEMLRLVHGEVETHYVNESPETRRSECRLWGMRYALSGSTKVVTGKVTDIETGEGITEAEIYFENGNLSADSGVDFMYQLNTVLMGVQKLVSSHPLYELWQEDQTLIEDANLVVNIKMRRL